MKNEPIKLEEFMYISTIAKYYGTEIVNNTKFAGFIDETKTMASPLYLTSNEVVSSKVLINRVSTFERKSFANVKLLQEILSKTTEDNPHFVSRMKVYLENVQEDSLDYVFERFTNNINSLKEEKYIDETEGRILTDYFNKMKEELKEDVKNDSKKDGQEADLNIF